MKVFSCGGVIPGCPEVFQAGDTDDLLGAVGGHARRDHGLVEIPPDVLRQVLQQIRDDDRP